MTQQFIPHHAFGYFTLAMVLVDTGLSKEDIHRLIEEGTFPRGEYQTNVDAPVWDGADVERWLLKQKLKVLDKIPPAQLAMYASLPDRVSP